MPNVHEISHAKYIECLCHNLSKMILFYLNFWKVLDECVGWEPLSALKLINDIMILWFNISTFFKLFELKTTLLTLC